MKKLSYTMEDEDRLTELSRALSSPIRLRIMKLLNEKSMSVNEISQALDIPMSSAAASVNVLEECGLISCEKRPGIHGHMKICSRSCESMFVSFHMPEYHGQIISTTTAMGIGQFTDCQITPGCGMISESCAITDDDDPAAFYLPERIRAQLMWFASGYVEYRFPKSFIGDMTVLSLELSFEACAEAPFYNNDFPSDITVWIAGKEIGTWTCPGDFGGRHGRITPLWWGDVLTQYGMLKTWMIDDSGSYLDNAAISPITIRDLELNKLSYITVRIGVKDTAVNKGGINLFGEQFGDHPQGLSMTIQCKSGH
jgi:predicted transcriptional regulator